MMSPDIDASAPTSTFFLLLPHLPGPAPPPSCPARSALSCSLQWSNYQLPISGLPGLPTASLTCGWLTPLATQYLKMTIAFVAFAGTLLLHKGLNLSWGLLWPDGRVTMPPVLAFPRLELIIGATTVICMSEVDLMCAQPVTGWVA